MQDVCGSLISSLTAHVDSERRAVMEYGIPPAVLACEIELLAAEAGHVGIAWG